MPCRDVDGTRVVWTKRPHGARPTKQQSLDYWAARSDTEAIMAKRESQAKESRGFKKVPSELNIWPPKNSPKGTQTVGLVSHVNPSGPFGLQVKIMTPTGEILTLASHKVLQGRLESVPGGLRPMFTVLRITFTGTEKSKKWPTPMDMYDLEYADRVKDGMIDLFGDVVPDSQTF
jgi:hypothetical protein